MTLQGSGQISLNDIRVEMGESGGNYSLTELSTVPKLNTGASPRPDGAAPHAMSEFYSYNHLTNASPTPTPTPTRNASPSVTPTLTPTVTPTATRNASPSVTPSVTPSITRNASPTPTPTPSTCFAFFTTTLYTQPSGTDCSGASGAFTAYHNTSPIEFGTRIYSASGCTSPIDGRFTDSSRIYTLVTGTVTNIEDCVA